MKRILTKIRNNPSHAILITGPTASGKSALAFDMAEYSGGEIISADSMQFYRGLDIGTAKPGMEERKRVPHHLLDILDISEKSDIFNFCELAENAIKDIRARGRTPIIAGGSGLYIRALLYGLDHLPAKQELRDELDAKYDNDESFPILKEIMCKSCPQDYERWHIHRRKLIRAYEVFLLSGSQISTLQRERHNPEARKDVAAFTLSWDREILKQRISSRTEEMLNSGWIEETERLLKKGLMESPTAWQALGYSIIAEYLAKKLTREEMREKIVIATWQFARRQITWFKHQHPESIVMEMPLTKA